MRKDKLLDLVENLGTEYERKFGGCSQCVVGAIRDVAGGVDDSVFKAATGLAGGVGAFGCNVWSPNRWGSCNRVVHWKGVPSVC